MKLTRTLSDDNNAATLNLTTESRPTNEQFSKHCHASYEILMVQNGNIDMQIEENVYPVASGGLVVIKPHLYHMASLLGKDVYDRAIFNFDERYLLSHGHAPLSAELKALTGCCFRLERDTFLFACYRRLFKAVTGNEDKAEMSGILNALLLSVHSALRLGDELTPLSGVVALSPLTRRALEIVESELMSPDFSLDKLSKQLYVSKSNLCGVFSREMGIGVMHYVTQKRLARAKDLLSDGVPAGDVAEMCGYRDYSTFYRAFTAAMNASPAQVKRGV